MKQFTIFASLIFAINVWAAEPKEFSFQSQNQQLKMSYLDSVAKKPNGKTVLLLHGKNFGAFYWQPTIDALNAEGFRVIAPDQIGFGRSSQPERYQFSFQALAANTNALLSKLKIKNVILVGHSMGGMLATRFALMYPQQVQKIVLINPIGLEDWKTKVLYHGIDEAYQQELKTTADSIREYQKKAYYAGEWKPEYEALIQPQIESLKKPNFKTIAWNAALTSDMLMTQPVMYEFGNLKAPTLLIIGLRDRTAPGRQWAPKEVAESLGDYPKLGKATAKLIPNSKLVEIEGAGHLPQIEKFEEYKSALLNFMK